MATIIETADSAPLDNQYTIGAGDNYLGTLGGYPLGDFADGVSLQLEAGKTYELVLSASSSFNYTLYNAFGGWTSAY
ncbi:MAG: hypothetical protein EBS68_14680, partial [Rhodobacteraceae bacterium]|nr:hypothetical protein [Paracoccaceae bacterium]